ncbi:MAG: hypothetical protein SF172_11665 [Burkholderiales bacterium]|nr:hypothetical protein [Burkholderiales bacterium]
MNETHIDADLTTNELPAEAIEAGTEMSLKTLTDLELAFVGGGTGNVIF